MQVPHLQRISAAFLICWLLLAPGSIYGQSWTISGSVVDAAGGPIAGVDLDLVDPLSPTTVIPISGDTSAIDGSFLLTINTTIPVGNYILQFEPTTAHLADEIDITLNGNLDIGAHALASGWLITGTVIDSAGAPVSGVDIDIRGDQAGWLDLVGDNTNAVGQFSVAIPAIIDEYRITFADTAADASVFPIENDLGLLFGSTDMGFVEMPTAHTLSGVVVDEDGVPLPGIDMNLYDAAGTTMDIFNDDTNLQGQFNVLVPEGTWTVRHRDVTPVPGIERVNHEISDLQVLANMDLGTIVLPRGYHVQGTVAGSAGELISGADFDAAYTSTGQSIYLSADTSDVTGSFDLLLPEGNLILEIDPPLAGPVRVSRRIQLTIAPVSPVNIGQIILEDGVTVSGSFVDGQGNPVPSVDVEFYLFSSGQIYETLHENGNQAGSFSANVPANDYNLTFTPPVTSGLGSLFLENVDCYAATSFGTLVMNPAATLSGVVTSAGMGLEGIQVTATDSTSGSTPPWGMTTTLADGSYVLQLTEGDWTVTATAPAGTGLSDITEANVFVNQGSSLNFEFPNLAPPITGLNCSFDDPVTTLTWVNGATYDWISIDRNGLPLTTVTGDQTTFTDSLPGSGSVEYSLRGNVLGISSPAVSCEVVIPRPFIRCDSDMGGNITISDAINVLSYLFSSYVTTCTDAMDCNDSGTINIADPVSLLNFLFGSGPLPAAPYPNPGQDPTADTLDCN
jgi:hypothetical protein